MAVTLMAHRPNDFVRRRFADDAFNALLGLSFLTLLVIALH